MHNNSMAKKTKVRPLATLRVTRAKRETVHTNAKARHRQPRAKDWLGIQLTEAIAAKATNKNLNAGQHRKE